MRLLPVCVCGILLSGLGARWVHGQEPPSAEPVIVAEVVPVAPTGIGADAWAEMIRTTVIAAMPEKNVQKKNWGNTAPRFSRYEIKTRHGRLTTMRPKSKDVNHGFWQRNTVTILQPDETLQIEFQNAQRLPDGKLVLTMCLVMRARVSTEFEHWVYGVKGLNGQVEVDVTVAVVTDCSFDLTAVQAKGEILPSIQLVPEITDLKLKVRDIDARKIGLIGGWAAEEIGDNSRSTVNWILHESEGVILKDLRRKIEKNQERLRFSPSWLWRASQNRPESPPRK